MSSKKLIWRTEWADLESREAHKAKSSKKRTQNNIKRSRLFPWRAEKQSNEKNVLEIYVIHENSEKTN